MKQNEAKWKSSCIGDFTHFHIGELAPAYGKFQQLSSDLRHASIRCDIVYNKAHSPYFPNEVVPGLTYPTKIGVLESGIRNFPDTYQRRLREIGYVFYRGVRCEGLQNVPESRGRLKKRDREGRGARVHNASLWRSKRASCARRATRTRGEQ